jgi:translation initiation factor IF-3
VRVGPPAEAPRVVAGAARDCSGRFFVGPRETDVPRGRAGSGSHPCSEVGEISQQKLRVNEQIRISPVRLIQDDGVQVGIVAIEEARRRADERGMDLVEVAPDSRPPVVKMMDYGKFRYEQQRASREARRKQHTAQVKEVKFRPGIEKHDYEFKTRHARRFLEEGNKVKLTMMFRGRQVTHPELGLDVLARVAEDLQDVGVAESQPSFEGRVMSMMLAPVRVR